MALELQPITQRKAFEFIKRFHRHHQPPRGSVWCAGVNNGEHLVGVIVVGRPVARMLQDGWTAEVTRCCIDPEADAKNAASMLYGAAARAMRATGYKRLITYIRHDEKGTSLVAAGWKSIYTTPAKSWNTPKRPRVDKTEVVQRELWSAWDWD